MVKLDLLTLAVQQLVLRVGNGLGLVGFADLQELERVGGGRVGDCDGIGTGGGVCFVELELLARLPFIGDQEAVRGFRLRQLVLTGGQADDLQTTISAVTKVVTASDVPEAA